MRKAVIAYIWSSTTVLSAPAAADSVRTVDQLCSAARRRADAAPEKARIFAAISAPATDHGPVVYDGHWQAVPTRQALEALVAEAAKVAEVAAYDEAFVWDLPGNSLVITTFATSSSGDWGHFVDYCFRADGTLALSRSTLNTSYGGVRRIRERRFSQSGTQLWTSTRVVDLVSGKVRRDAQFMDQDEPIFKTRAALPFAQLL